MFYAQQTMCDGQNPFGVRPLFRTAMPRIVCIGLISASRDYGQIHRRSLDITRAKMHNNGLFAPVKLTHKAPLASFRALSLVDSAKFGGKYANATDIRGCKEELTADPMKPDMCGRQSFKNLMPPSNTFLNRQKIVVPLLRNVAGSLYLPKPCVSLHSPSTGLRSGIVANQIDMGEVDQLTECCKPCPNEQQEAADSVCPMCDAATKNLIALNCGHGSVCATCLRDWSTSWILKGKAVRCIYRPQKCAQRMNSEFLQRHRVLAEDISAKYEVIEGKDELSPAIGVNVYKCVCGQIYQRDGGFCSTGICAQCNNGFCFNFHKTLRFPTVLEEFEALEFESLPRPTPRHVERPECVPRLSLEGIQPDLDFPSANTNTVRISELMGSDRTDWSLETVGAEALHRN